VGFKRGDKSASWYVLKVERKNKPPNTKQVSAEARTADCQFS